jgi:Protein of unknown function (DUF2752)
MRTDPTRDLSPVLPAQGNDRPPFDARGHWVILGLSIAVLLGGLLVDVNADGSIYLRGLPQFPFPIVCPLRRFFGISCPTCGMTRSIVFLVQGRLADSFAVHRLGWLIFALIVLQIPYRMWCLATKRIVPYRPRLIETVFAVFTLLLVLNWLFS